MSPIITAIAKSGLPKSIRKYIRQQKARIRREHSFDIAKQKEEENKLYEKFKITYTKKEHEEKSKSKDKGQKQKQQNR